MGKTKTKAEGKGATAKPLTMAYCRVSSLDQDLEKFRFQILDYANKHNLAPVDFVEEKISGAVSWRRRMLGQALDQLKPGDVLLTPELSRLGRSLIEVLEVLNLCRGKNVKIIGIKENFVLNGNDLTAKVMSTLLALFAEVERDLLSLRIREGLAARKAKGFKLGRKPGRGTSKLDVHRDAIIALLKTGSTKTYIAKRYGTTPANLFHWLHQNELDRVNPEYDGEAREAGEKGRKKGGGSIEEGKARKA
jgi:DNA invertase Pin-like site-specific DNA recombinase